MQTLAPGLMRSEGTGDEPQRCGEIGCPCVIGKKLLDFRQGATLVFVCPSSRISVSFTPGSRGIAVPGHYSGGLR